MAATSSTVKGQAAREGVKATIDGIGWEGTTSHL